MKFADPEYLLLLLLLIPLIWQERRQKRPAAVRSTTAFLLKPNALVRWFYEYFGLSLRCLALILLVLGLARPQDGRTEHKKRTEGLDIMLVVDTSGSMKAMDFTHNGRQKNRLEVVKSVLEAFVDQRADDRIGLVVFGSQAYAQAPLTLDHEVLSVYLNNTEIGMAGESTAIGDALGVAVNRLKDIKAKDKIIILLTDGTNTAGKLEPLQAAEAAKALGIKVYAIGIGSNKPVPVPTPFGYQRIRVDMDRETLTKISEITEAEVFFAKDTEALKEVYETIDRLEKTEAEIDVYHHVEEKFAVFVWPGLVLVLLELLFSLSKYRRIP